MTKISYTKLQGKGEMFTQSNLQQTAPSEMGFKTKKTINLGGGDVDGSSLPSPTYLLEIVTDSTRTLSTA